MSCSSCKEKRKTYGTGVPNVVIENKSIGIKILIFIVKLILFLIASTILTIIVIPFSIYVLAKVFFYDGSVDVEGMIVGVKKWVEGRKDKREDKKEDKNKDDYEYDYADVEEIKEED